MSLKFSCLNYASKLEAFKLVFVANLLNDCHFDKKVAYMKDCL